MSPSPGLRLTFAPAMRRPLVLLAVLLAGLMLNACGKADEPTSEGETEAVYLELGGLQYQVQVSRQLNQYDVEDRSYIQGATGADTPLGPDDTWFGVFIRVYNAEGGLREPTSDFEVHDTQGNVYKPVPLDDSNVFRYEPIQLGKAAMIPTPGSIAYNGPVRGALLLFRMKIESLENRPLELIITQAGVEGHAEVALDV
jgi:hypothetical protein